MAIFGGFHTAHQIDGSHLIWDLRNTIQRLMWFCAHPERLTSQWLKRCTNGKAERETSYMLRTVKSRRKVEFLRCTDFPMYKCGCPIDCAGSTMNGKTSFPGAQTES